MKRGLVLKCLVNLVLPFTMASIQEVSVLGETASFVRPKFTLHQPPVPDPKEILTLPDLVEFNARQNPDHTFCLQYHHNVALAPRRITMAELQDAVLRCSTWLIEQGMAYSPTLVEGRLVKAPPVAILMSSDVGWFIYFLALLRLGVPVRLFGSRDYTCSNSIKGPLYVRTSLSSSSGPPHPCHEDSQCPCVASA